MSYQPKDVAADRRAGARFGEYRIDSLIGVGAMGRAYRAIATEVSAAALKLVKDDLARNEAFKRRFRREAPIARTVHNPVSSQYETRAIEQIRGEPVTGASDVYSLGFMVFECLTGHPPSADRQGMRVLWAHLEDDPPDLCAERSGIRPDFARAVNAALAKQPGGRPRTSVEYARSVALAAGISIGDAST